MRRVVVTSLSLAASLVATSAFAGNAETFYLGADAPLLAGAVTATTEGASALWYNPGRISEGAGDSIDVSVSAYMLRFGGATTLENASPNVSLENAKGIDFQAVPTAIAYKRRFGGWDFALGLFVPTSSQSSTRTKVESQSANPTRFVLDASDVLTEYYAGIGTAHEIVKDLAVGASVFGYYASETTSQILGATLGDGTFITNSGTHSESRYGVQGSLGLSWGLFDRLHLGFAVHTPVWKISSSAKQSFVESQGGPSLPAAAEVNLTDDALEDRAGVLSPARAEAGVAFDASDKTTVSADVRLRAPYSNHTGRVAHGVVDVRAGVQTRVSEQVWLGGGAFTDRNATTSTGDPSGTRFDYYGATFAVQLGRPYRVVDAEQQSRSLRFATTLALSYAFGLGRVGNLAVQESAGNLQINPSVDRATAHEFVFSIGSTLSNVLGP